MALITSVKAAPGDVDLLFNPTAISREVLAISPQPDGKIYVGGTFTNIDGNGQNLIARLTSDGDLDTSFVPTTQMYTNPADPYFFVEAMAVQTDGKVVIGGGFYNPDDFSAPANLIRLNTNGTWDDAYRPKVDTVYAMALQPDGKLLIGGFFTIVNGTNRNNIARLNTDGTLDTSFDPGSGANSAVLTMALQGDGKILIGGAFTTVGGISYPYIARLNEDGDVDESFNVSVDSRVYSIALQSDGKILLGGWFGSVNFTISQGVARLDSSGLSDSTFNAGTTLPGGAGYGKVYSVLSRPDGKVVVGGVFTYMDGTAVAGIAQLNSDGSLDTAFTRGPGITNSAGVARVGCLGIQADNKILFGGAFTGINGVSCNALGRLWSDWVAIPLSIQRTSDSVVLSWSDSTFSLQAAPDLGGVFTDVPGATSPYTNTIIGSGQYFRLRAN